MDVSPSVSQTVHAFFIPVIKIMHRIYHPLINRSFPVIRALKVCHRLEGLEGIIVGFVKGLVGAIKVPEFGLVYSLLLGLEGSVLGSLSFILGLARFILGLLAVSFNLARFVLGPLLGVAGLVCFVIGLLLESFGLVVSLTSLQNLRHRRDVRHRRVWRLSYSISSSSVAYEGGPVASYLPRPIRSVILFHPG